MSSILPSQIKNKIKREEVHAKQRQEKNRRKLELRLQRRKEEAEDPSKKEVCLSTLYTKCHFNLNFDLGTSSKERP